MNSFVGVKVISPVGSTLKVPWSIVSVFSGSGVLGSRSMVVGSIWVDGSAMSLLVMLKLTGVLMVVLALSSLAKGRFSVTVTVMLAGFECSPLLSATV